MTSESIAIDMPAQSGYGAVELKAFIRKYTFQGFIITVSLLILFLLVYYIYGEVLDSSRNKTTLVPIVKMTLENLPPPTNDADVVPPDPTQINTGPAARAGTPIPVPDAKISPDIKEFATLDVQARASAEGGSGLDLGGFASNIDFDKKVEVKVVEKEPEPDEFVAVEKEPGINLEDLQKLIQYPDLAKRANVEGKVVIRVLIGKDGKPVTKKILVEYSDSELLNEAALEAVKKYRGYTPAIQNGQPVACWLSIPVQFRLR